MSGINMCLLTDGPLILALENKRSVCLKKMCKEKSREQMSKKERAVIKTSGKKHLQQTTLLGSKQEDGAVFSEALGFLRSELDLKDQA